MPARSGARQDNPADHATPPKVPRTHPVSWDPQTTRQFLDALDAHPHPCGGVWRACLMFGLRRGEAIALRWQDIDLDSGVLRVERSYGRAGKAGLQFN